VKVYIRGIATSLALLAMTLFIGFGLMGCGAPKTINAVFISAGTKTEYNLGQHFDLNSTFVDLHFSDGSVTEKYNLGENELDLEISVSGYNRWLVSDKLWVTIKIEEFSAGFFVKIS
jgi:hypothetical protein